MRILVTGSSGWLGQTLVPRLRSLGHEVVGLDPAGGLTTDMVGSIEDRSLVRDAMRGADAVIHSGALHKPDIVRRPNDDFVSVNVRGTLNLLEEAVAQGVSRFVFTSTTSLMISETIRAGLKGGAKQAFWIDETMAPLEPRNIYGVSKLAAEHLCRLFHIEHKLPVVILRTSRFFPEDDDMSNEIEQSAENTKANELLFRRLSVEDAAEAHVLALDQAPRIGFDTFIVSAPTPFRPADCAELIDNAPAVVARVFPDYAEKYARLGWTMFRSIDRVYDASKAERVMGFRAKGFAEMLAAL